MNKPKEKQKLKPRQEQVLGFIRDFIEEHQYPPTVVEISDHFGFKSKNAAQDHLKVLQSKGHIERVFNVSRGIRLL